MKLGEHFPNKNETYSYYTNNKRLTVFMWAHEDFMQLPDVVLFYLDYFDIEFDTKGVSVSMKRPFKSRHQVKTIYNRYHLRSDV